MTATGAPPTTNRRRRTEWLRAGPSPAAVRRNERLRELRDGLYVSRRCRSRVPPGTGRVCRVPCYAGSRVDDPRTVAGFSQSVRFVSVDPLENRFRFYELRWQSDLWRGAALVQAWGRLGTTGQKKAHHYPDRDHARADIERAIRERLRRGYRLVSAT
jgi:predicted DNA-binding WGR domain protein